MYSFADHTGESLAVRCDSQELFCFTLIVLGREKLIREHFYPQADDKMRRSGSNSTSDMTGLNLILLPIVTSPSLQHLHNTSTARDPRETAISAALSWSLFKKLFGWNSECNPSREQSCAYLQGLRGLGAITKTFRHQVEERQKKKKGKKKLFYIGSYHHPV